MSTGPSFTKLTLAVAAGIVLAGLVIVFGLTGMGVAAERRDTAEADKDRAAIVACIQDATRRAKTMAEVLPNREPCLVLEGEYRVKWNREP